ncbi:hypothetical protein ACHAQA_001551 [Verticillium albo-atrum]
MSPNAGPILLLGGTGKVSRNIAALLAETEIPTLQASRSGVTTEPAATNMSGISFDWTDQTTYARALSANPRAVFLVAPPVVDMFPLMSAFVDAARAGGTRRFVLLSSSALEPDEEGVAMGRVHAYLKALGEKGEVDWGVLRPSWFQAPKWQRRTLTTAENLAEHMEHVTSIKGEGKVHSATGEGRIPWVAVKDIAASAFQLLTQKEAPSDEYLLSGPELLSYGDVATILSDVLGRKIVHHDQTPRERRDMFISTGMPEGYAEMMVKLDVDIKNGSEERTNDVILTLTGKAPRKFRDMVEQRKEVWLSDI